jgi:hypothetical protein
MRHSGVTDTRFALAALGAAAVVLLAACASHPVPSTAAARPTPPAAAPSGSSPAIAPATPTATAPAGAGTPARLPAPAPLVGRVTRATLEAYETWKTLRAQDYTPDAAAVEAIGARGRDVDVLAIVATWCPDSKREVPRFFKIYDQAGIGLGNVTLVGVDRTKKDAGGLAEKHQVTRVPTFVFFRGGQEIGRVTERAVTTLEGDIAAILVK